MPLTAALPLPTAFVSLCLLAFDCAHAAAPANPIPLWPEGAPGSTARRQEPEKVTGSNVSNIHHPSLTPYWPEAPAPGGPAFFASLFRGGDLDVKDPERARLLALLARCPTIVDIALERPAVIPEIASACAVLLANFGASDAALLDVVFGRAVPRGTLPFELPSSMAAVRRQQSDVPYDSAEPLFPYGAGLR